MLWDAAEAAIRAHIETQWALSGYTTTALVFENETVDTQDSYMVVNIEGLYSEKSVYGGPNTRLYVESGIVFFHCFAPNGWGKQAALGPVVALNAILELQTISDVIKLEGGNPPSPAELDTQIPNQQPGGNYYRVSGSVPFILIGS